MGNCFGVESSVPSIDSDVRQHNIMLTLEMEDVRDYITNTLVKTAPELSASIGVNELRHKLYALFMIADSLCEPNITYSQLRIKAFNEIFAILFPQWLNDPIKGIASRLPTAYYLLGVCEGIQMYSHMHPEIIKIPISYIRDTHIIR